MKRFFAVIVVVLLTALLSPVSSASADTKQTFAQVKEQYRAKLEADFKDAKGYECSLLAQTLRVKFKEHDGYDRAKSVTYYKQCLPKDNHGFMFVKVVAALHYYNAYGAHMTCNSFFRRLDGFGFNMYYWIPSNGVSYNPGEVNVPCDESTQNFAKQSFPQKGDKKAPRMYYFSNGADNTIPRMKTNIERQKNNSTNDYRAKWDQFALFGNLA